MCAQNGGILSKERKYFLNRFMFRRNTCLKESWCGGHIRGTDQRHKWTLVKMFRKGPSDRFDYLQSLVTEFQDTDSDGENGFILTHLVVSVPKVWLISAYCYLMLFSVWKPSMFSFWVWSVQLLYTMKCGYGEIWITLRTKLLSGGLFAF